MASSTEEVAVFTDTNLGTHIAMAVSPDITARDFKRELEKTHFSCFPKVGVLKVHGLKVKRRSSFYHLPDLMPIKYAFQGLKGTWFLHMEAGPMVDLDSPGLSQCIDAKVGNHNLDVTNVSASLITSTEKNGVISNDNKNIRRYNGSATLSQALSRAVPLSKRKRKKEKSVNNFFRFREDGMDKRCLCKNDAPVLAAKSGFGFSVSQNEVESAVAFNSKPFVEIPSERCSNSSNDVAYKTVQNHSQKLMEAKTDVKCSSMQIDALPTFAVRTPPRSLSFPVSSQTNLGLGSPRNKSGKTDVGKRLVRASKNLNNSVGKKRSAISFRKFKNGKFLGASASSVAKFLAFEISDNDD